MRLIDADALKSLLIETLENIAKKPAMDGQEMHIIAGCHMLCEMIDDADTVDAEIVRHGEWIHDINNLYGCSECFNRETMSLKRLKPYCPNCGAKMDGGKQDVEAT